MNETMQAYAVQDGKLQLITCARPAPAAGELLIRTAYAGINRADLLQTQGLYPPPEGASDIVGLEVSGHVVALGDGVAGYNIGDAVCALLDSGGYAEYVAAPASLCLQVPLPVKESGGVMECAIAVWMSVFDECRLQPGETLLVHGGASGIGTTAIQMAQAWGATVFATAGSDEKCELIRTLGATAIHYRTQDFVEIVKAAGGADVVLDMVGGDYIPRNLQSLRAGGRLVSIACLHGAKVEMNMGGLLMRGLRWHGSTLRRRSVSEKAALIAAMRPHLLEWIAQNRFRVVLDEVFPFKKADLALARMQQGLHCGKILLQVGS